MNAVQLTSCNCQLGEGPVWHAATQTLYWVDIEGRQFKRLNPETGAVESRTVPERVGAAVPAENGKWVFAQENGFHWFDWDTQTLELIEDPEAGDSTNRFNDGKVGPDGRFWAGTMGLTSAKGTGSLYRLGHHLQVKKFAEGISCSNGLAWTADKRTFYYIDTPTQKVDAFDYDPISGAATNRRTAFEVPKENGFPDGMAIDAEDRLWLGHWGGGAVICYDPKTGKELERIEVAAKNVTSCCFGGPDLKDLYITTARISTSNEELERFPYAGSIFIVKNLTQGTQIPLFHTE